MNEYEVVNELLKEINKNKKAIKKLKFKTNVRLAILGICVVYLYLKNKKKEEKEIDE